MDDFRASFYTLLWIIWGAYFAIVEGCALFGLGSRYGTLSQHIWHLMDRKPFWVWFVLGGLIWLFVHFATRGKHA